MEVWKNAISILRTFWNDEKNKEDDDSDSMGQSQSGAAGKGKGWKSKNMEQETLKAIVSEKESNYQFLTTVLYLFETSNFIVCFEHFFDF